MNADLLQPKVRRPRRWTPTRKFEVCRQIIAGEATVAAIAAEHDLPPNELQEWLRRCRSHGVRGLSITKRERAHG